MRSSVTCPVRACQHRCSSLSESGRQARQTAGSGGSHGGGSSDGVLRSRWATDRMSSNATAVYKLGAARRAVPHSEASKVERQLYCFSSTSGYFDHLSGHHPYRRQQAGCGQKAQPGGRPHRSIWLSGLSSLLVRDTVIAQWALWSFEIRPCAACWARLAVLCQNSLLIAAFRRGPL